MGNTFSRVTIGLAVIAAFLPFQALAAPADQPVVVELFTSEGCSSCPPADAFFTQLNQPPTSGGAQLILLGEHVEYWNSPGWTDRFSGPAYTQRQADYVRQLHLATPYTPQMVIDGHLQAVGNNVSVVRRMIAEAAAAPKPAEVSIHFVSPGKVQVSVTDSTQGRERVLFAVAEDNLTSKVRGGENDGRVLTHAAVVRELRQLGNTSNGTFEKTVNLPSNSDWKKPDLHVIVLVQNPSSGLILGAASVPYSPPVSAAADR